MQNVLAFVDFSDVTSHILDTACAIALAFHCKLDVIHVAMPDSELRGDEFPADVSRQGAAHELRRIHRALEIFQKELRARWVDATALLVRSSSQRGNPAAKILEEAERRKADLIVMGTHGYGALHHLVVGSTSDAVIRKARCPVLLVPSRTERDSDARLLTGARHSSAD